MLEVLKQMVEALEYHTKQTRPISKTKEAIQAGKQAIAELESQEPVALQMDVIVVNLVREGINKHRARELAEHFIKHTHPPQRTKVVFPTMLRKMWSGGEVQAWLDENVNKE